MQTLDCRYMIFGKEVGESGTPHIQGYVVFKKQKRLAAMKKIHPKAHWEIAKGTTEQSIAYCSKEDPAPFVRGDPPSASNAGQATRDRYASAVSLAKKGNLEEIMDNDPDLYLRYMGALKAIAKDYMLTPEPLPAPCGLWIYGPSGSGKSHSVINQCPDRYIKPLNKWWDGYRNQDVVHLDEVEPSHAAWIVPYLKKWADKWPFDAEIKGTATQLRPKQIVVTSNYSIDEMGFPPQDLPAIKRRYREVLKTREQDIIIKP